MAHSTHGRQANGSVCIVTSPVINMTKSCQLNNEVKIKKFLLIHGNHRI